VACCKGSNKTVDILSCKILKKLLTKTLNGNQLLLLNKIAENKENTISSLLNGISKENRIPLSTLKLSSKKLKDLELIDCGDYRKVELTNSGMLVLNVLKGVNI